MPPKKQLTDPTVLKGLAQPIRQHLFRLLSQTGPATASGLARRIGSDPGLVSYHLRELGKCGFIEEAPELARDRRERWWRAVPGSVSWASLDFHDAEHLAVAKTMKAQMVVDEFERVRRFEEDLDSWPREWRDAAAVSEFHLRLTPDQLRELSKELAEVVGRWSAGEPQENAEQVFVFFHGFPEKIGTEKIGTERADQPNVSPPQ